MWRPPQPSFFRLPAQTNKSHQTVGSIMENRIAKGFPSPGANPGQGGQRFATGWLGRYLWAGAPWWVPLLTVAGGILVGVSAAGVLAQESHSPAPGWGPDPQVYTVSQAVSREAQLHTLAFAGLAYLTGSPAEDSFFPPGKLADYFGFQFLRDNDPGGRGHQGDFLTTIAQGVLAVLDERQRSELVELAEAQAPVLESFARARLPLLQAFRRSLPASAPTLDRGAVLSYSGRLYQLDMTLASQRAVVMARVLRSLTPAQQRALAQVGRVPGGRAAAEVLDRRQFSHRVHEAVLTYAADLFAWQRGNPEADTYFCPERHATYFGSFGLKTAPVHSRPQQGIDPRLTGDGGAAFLSLLAPRQRQRLEDLVLAQQPLLGEIVVLRRNIAAELRHPLAGEPLDTLRLQDLARRYGELDGALSYGVATTLATLAQELTPAQQILLKSLRARFAQGEVGHGEAGRSEAGRSEASRQGPYLFADPVERLPTVPVEFLFGHGPVPDIATFSPTGSWAEYPPGSGRPRPQTGW